MLTVRNRSGNLVLVGDNYLFPGQTRQLPDAMARAAVANNPGMLDVAPEPAIEVAPTVAPVGEQEDWTQVSGIGPQLHEALHYMGLHTKGDIRAYVATNGVDTLLRIPGLSTRRLAALMAYIEEA
jgi:predicted flap endonuclease-1-like 5' DNA nuclease